MARPTVTGGARGGALGVTALGICLAVGRPAPAAQGAPNALAATPDLAPSTAPHAITTTPATEAERTLRIARELRDIRRLERSGALDRARARGEALLAQDGPARGVGSALARIYRALADGDAELALLRRWLESEPGSAEAAGALATRLVESGDRAEAADVLRSTVTARPDSRAAHGQTARHMTILGLHEDALEAYSTARAHFAEPGLFAIQVARLLRALGRTEEAALGLVEALSGVPGASAERELLALETAHPGAVPVPEVAAAGGAPLAARILVSRGDVEGALALFPDGVDIPSADLSALLAATELRASEHDVEPLLLRLRAALPAGPDRVRVELRHARILVETGRPVAAVAVLEPLLSETADPTLFAEVLVEAGSAARRVADVERGRRWLRAAVADLSPPVVRRRAALELARLEIGDGRPDSAATVLEAVLPALGSDAGFREEAQWLRGECDLHTERLAEAAARYRQLAAERPESPWANDALDRLLLLGGATEPTPVLSTWLEGERCALLFRDECAAGAFEVAAGSGSPPLLALRAADGAARALERMDRANAAARLLARVATRLGDHPGVPALLALRASLLEEGAPREEALRTLILEHPESVEADAARRARGAGS